MITFESDFDFIAVLDDDDDIVLTGKNTVHLKNKGEQTAVINDNYPIAPGETLTLGGRENSTVEQTLAVTFTGSGTKALYQIYETLTDV